MRSGFPESGREAFLEAANDINGLLEVVTK